MSNKFLNPSGDTDLSDVIARVNGNTEAIQDHVADLANPHTTSTSNIDPQPFTSDEVPEGATNRYLVQPFVGSFDMGGGQIINTTGVGNPAGQTAIAGVTSVSVYDPAPAPLTGVLTQTFGGKSVEILADGSFTAEATNGDVKLEAPSGNVILEGTGNTALVGGQTTISETTTNMGMLFQSNSVGISQGLTNIASFTPTANKFLQDVDMFQNEIKNVSVVDNSAGNLILSSSAAAGLSGTSGASIGESTTNMSMAFVSNSASINQGATNIASFTPTLNSSFQDLDMDSNDIKNVSNINMVSGGSAELFNVFRINGDSTNSLFLSGNAVSATANSQDVNLRCLNASSCIRFRVGASGSPDRLFVCDADIKSFVPLNMDSNAIENVASINGLSVIGGNSSGTSNSALLTASATETSILPTTFIGSRQVPADAFQQGNSFSATLAGSFGSQNGDDITIRLKGGATATTLLSSVVVPLNSSSASSFELDIQFSVRQTGAAGVAELVTNYAFTYNQSGGGGAFVGERNCEINTTTFDTTILNQLDITAQFSSANANNSIQTFMSNLHKIY